MAFNLTKLRAEICKYGNSGEISLMENDAKAECSVLLTCCVHMVGQGRSQLKPEDETEMTAPAPEAT